MPPKPARGGGRNKGDEAKQEEPLQAILLADSFETKFSPFTHSRPRCLLPLINTPLLEYTLEYLARSGVQEVYLYPGAHADQVESYLSSSKWKLGAPPFSLDIMRCGAGSIGDIMRDVDNKGIIKGDFICIQGDVISDFPIHKALKAHKVRREKDKNAIMTMCLRERSESDGRSSRQMVQTFVIDPAKDRCLHYEEGRAGASFGAHLEADLLKVPELDIHQDLIDCRIDICTPDALSLWTDNFDNQQPRRDYLRTTLKDYELNGKTIHTYIITDHYATRVEDAAAYARISWDLQHELAGSLMPTNNLSGTRFKRLRNDIAREDDVIIQRPAKLLAGTIIGEDCSIGANTIVKRSVIGRRVLIGKRTTMDSAYIWDDVTIGSNVSITSAIVGSEAFIGDGCVIEAGALISFGAKVPAGRRVVSGQKVMAETSFDEDRATTGATNGDAFESDDEEEFDPDWATSFYKQGAFTSSYSSIATDASAETENQSQGGSRSTSFAIHQSDDETGERFVSDTVGILVTRMQEGQKVENVQSELMGLRFSGDGDSTLVFKAVATAFTKHLNSEVAGGKSPKPAAEQLVEDYRDIIWRPNTSMTTEDQVVFLLAAQRDLSKRSEGSKIMPWFFMTLFQQDVFKEDTFHTWFADERAREGDMLAMKVAAKPFMDWLEDADEESSEDESEEESD